jgi:hypothetical protein
MFFPKKWLNRKSNGTVPSESAPQELSNEWSILFGYFCGVFFK